MVFFACDGCGESLKKNQVQKHMFSCRSQTFSCMDCQKAFTRQTYVEHIKCISENEKYGGANYQAKENKGEVKQERWTEQVENAINNVKSTNPRLKGLLTRILGFTNIPRKEAKFVNFLKNSVRINDEGLCREAWKAISEEAAKLASAAPVVQKNGQATNGVTNGAIGKNGTASANDESATASTNGITAADEKQNGDSIANGEARPFKWKATIKRKLKTVEDRSIKLKKLRKEVIDEYRSVYPDGADEDSLNEVFDSKLVSSGVVVDGKLAKLPE